MTKALKLLSSEQKNVVIELYTQGVKQNEIARLFSVNRSTICRIVSRFRSTGNVENCPRSGRPNLLSSRDQRSLLRDVKCNRSTPLSEITAKFNHHRNKTVSRRTIQRVLFKAGYHRRVVRKAIRVRKNNKRNRVAWCRGKRNLPITGYWDRVVFSDESKVDIGLNSRVYIWRKVGEEWLPACTAPPPRKRISVMIWGCVTFNGVGTLAFVDGNINADKYINILEDNLWPVIARHFPKNDYIYQDDNAPVHRARSVVKYRLENKIRAMTWPAQSPDLNIIENVWYRLKRELQREAESIHTVDDLQSAIRCIWENLPVNYIRSLYQSIPRRITSVLKANGNITKY